MTEMLPTRLSQTLTGDLDYVEWSLVTDDGAIWSGRTEKHARELIADLIANPVYLDGEGKPKPVRLVSRTVHITVSNWKTVEDYT